MRDSERMEDLYREQLQRFLELKEELSTVIKQLKKKPNNEKLCRRKEELTETMRALTEMMIQTVSNNNDEQQVAVSQVSARQYKCIQIGIYIYSLFL